VEAIRHPTPEPAGSVHERRVGGSGWYRAITLSERAAMLATPPATELSAAFDAALAERRLQRWRSQTPFADAALFSSRLAIDGLDEPAFVALLGTSPDEVQQRLDAAPAWLATLTRAMTQPAPTSLRLGRPDQPDQADFLIAVEPLIADGQRRLHQAFLHTLQGRSNLPFDADVIQTVLVESLTHRLTALVCRTMILELNVARIEGRLAEPTPEARYQSFLRSLGRRDVVLALFEEYPVLARLLTTAIDQWVSGSLDFLHDLATDWEAITRRFAPAQEPGRLVKLDTGAGDPHQGGRSVSIATFSSGFRLVYKPKSLAAAVHFGELLDWLNERGAEPAFRGLNILDRGDHGWVEFVEVADCTSGEGVRRFYERQGGYLALLYAISAADFHYENLLAAGEHPILIDLEGVFHPRVASPDQDGAVDPADNVLNDSVLGLGLLPQRSWATGASDGVDISGLGGQAGQVIPGGNVRLEAAGTDEARYAQSDGTLPRGRHRPRLDGVDADPLDYVEAIVAGFTRTYQHLSDLRGDLLAPDGPLARFEHDEVRVLVRPTQVYATLLHASRHPNVLRDALDRDRLLDRLWVGVERRPKLAALVAAEHRDLEIEDIPLFTTAPTSPDIWASTGERLTGLIDETGLSRARRRIERLGAADLAYQTWIIRASLATLPSSRTWTQRPPTVCTAPSQVPDPARFLAAARAVGDRLEALAVRGEDGGVGWVGLSITPRENWILAPVWLDLYDGLPGISLFLAYLGSVTDERRYTALAESGLATIQRLIERDGDTLQEVGAFSGWGGLIYAFTHLAALWQRPDLLAQADAIVERLSDLSERDTRSDIVFGAAGGIISLLTLYEQAPSQRILDAATRCGERLLAQAQPMEHGVAWAGSAKFAQPLAGLSHGAAGIAWALLKLAALTGDARFRATALDAIAYERSLFSADAQNWPDLRQSGEDGHATFMTAWCHGAPGIGLARLYSRPFLDDAEIRAEIATALATTRAFEHSLSHSLCHGSLGNLELVLQASQALGLDQWCDEAHRSAGALLDAAERDGWRCGTPRGVESPGLMTGLAGIGYGLLRLAAPAAVPSMLALEPPRRPVDGHDTRRDYPRYATEGGA
jgi:type 2 lantibiotic biosynthesis protein LanM